MLRNRITFGTAFTGLAVLAAGCQNDRAEPFAPDDLSGIVPAQQSVLRAAPGQEELVSALPGFGGLFLDRDGVPTVYLTNPFEVEGADAEVADYLGRRGFDSPEIRVLLADFSLLELDRWFGEASPAVMELDRAVYIDLDERANRLTIGVEDEATAARARGIARSRGIPEAAVEVVLTEPIELAATLQDKVRPVAGGLQINFSIYACTLGFNATANVSGGGGGGGGGGKGGGNGKGNSGTTATPTAVQDVYVTNSHCTDKQGGTEDTQHYQPLAPDLIGTEVADPTYSGNLPGCPRGRKCRYSDSSLGAYAAGVNHDLRNIKQTAPGSLTITGDYTITSEADPVFGEILNKTGRTTGRTQGNVVGTCVTTNVSGSNITQLCQSFVAAGVGGGDSGSPVFALAGGDNVTLKGILWGSSGETLFVFSPMSGIERELGDLTTH
jgi:hypothetical protein